jgi:F-type H+-transporting ATPase subunit b
VLLGSSSGSNTNFILPNGTFFAELIIFLVVLGVIAWFILPSLRRVLDERAHFLTGAQRALETARAEASRLDKERATVLEIARASARAILEGAARSADEFVEEARARGQAENDRRVADATGAIEAERRRVHAAVMAEAVALVVAAAERIVGGGLDAERHRETIAAALADAEATAPGGGRGRT